MSLFSKLFGKKQNSSGDNKKRHATNILRNEEVFSQQQEQQENYEDSKQSIIVQLESKITQRFIEFFEEAGEPINITSWADRFNLVNICAENSIPATTNWIMSFEDTQAPYATFNLHMVDNEPEDFSIDT